MLKTFLSFIFLFYSLNTLSCQSLNLNDQIIDLTSISSRYNSSLSVWRYNYFVDCRYFVGFTQGSSGSYTSRKMYNGLDFIEYDLSQKTNFQQDLKDYPNISNGNEAIDGRFRFLRGSLSETHSFYLRPKNISSTLAAGTYQDTVNVKLYYGRYNQYNYLVDTSNLTIRYIVPYQISLSLVAPGAPHNAYSSGKSLDFGILQTGEKDFFDIVVVSNSNFQVRFSSQNDGRMKHLTANSFVDYTLNVGGSIVNLMGSSSGPVSGPVGSGPTPSSGSRFQSSITIGAINNQLAGSYKDVITVSVVNI